MMNQSDTVPKLKIEQYLDGDLYALRGWDDLDEFGYHHSNTWQKTVDSVRHFRLQEEHLLKVLIRSLLEENLSLHERLQEMIIRYGVPIKPVCRKKGDNRE